MVFKKRDVGNGRIEENKRASKEYRMIRYIKKKEYINIRV